MRSKPATPTRPTPTPPPGRRRQRELEAAADAWIKRLLTDGEQAGGGTAEAAPADGQATAREGGDCRPRSM